MWVKHGLSKESQQSVYLNKLVVGYIIPFYHFLLFTATFTERYKAIKFLATTTRHISFGLCQPPETWSTYERKPQSLAKYAVNKQVDIMCKRKPTHPNIAFF